MHSITIVFSPLFHHIQWSLYKRTCINITKYDDVKLLIVRVVNQLGRKALMIGRPSILHFEHAQKDYIMLKWKD